MRHGIEIFKQSRSAAAKNPGLAGFLNILFPGLGCAYLGKWLYALAYLIWVPLALMAASALSGVVAETAGLFFPRPVVPAVVSAVFLFAFRAIVLWDVFFTPYRLAEELNDERKGNFAQAVDVLKHEGGN